MSFAVGVSDNSLVALLAGLLALALTVGIRGLCRLLRNLLFQLFWKPGGFWTCVFWTGFGFWVWINLFIWLAHVADSDLTPVSVVSCHYRSGGMVQVLVLLRNAWAELVQGAGFWWLE